MTLPAIKRPNGGQKHRRKARVSSTRGAFLMFSSAGCIHGLKYQTRAIAPLLGDTEKHRFLVGTTSLREQNELYLLDFNEESNDLHEYKTFSHPGEVWSISPSPRDPSLTFTSYSKGNKHECTLWRLPGVSKGADIDGSSKRAPPPSPGTEAPLEAVVTLPTPRGRVRCALWSPEQGGANTQPSSEHVVTVDEDTIHYWSLNSGQKGATEVGSARVTDGRDTVAGGWDPHDTNKVATAQKNGVTWWDLRTLKPAASVEMAHKHGIRDVDFNCSKPFFLVTCGDDRLIKFWDSRKLNAPVKHVAGHTHWAWTVRYNRCHDQLLLSAGTDSIVNLWRVSSISSAPLLEMEDPSSNDSPDVKVKSFDEHEESVYSVAWSACDPFVFVSVSYDGRVVLNHVPSTEKYRILL